MMTGYLFLILTVLCGSAKGYMGKRSSGALSTLPSMLTFNAWRTAACALLAALIWGFEGSFAFPGVKAIAVSAVSGISMSIFLLSWVASVRRGAYVRLDVCCQTGMVIPCVFAAPLFGESVSVWQYLALGALVIAIILLNDRKKNDRAKLRKRDLLLLFTVWLTSGVNSLTLKLYAAAGGTKTLYNLITFAVAAATFGIARLLLCGKEKVALPKTHYTVYIPFLAAALYLHLLFSGLAADRLDAMILFPLQTVLGLLISTLMAAFLFHEKPTAKNVAGVIISAGAIIVMNMT